DQDLVVAPQAAQVVDGLADGAVDELLRELLVVRLDDEAAVEGGVADADVVDAGGAVVGPALREDLEAVRPAFRDGVGQLGVELAAGVAGLVDAEEDAGALVRERDLGALEELAEVHLAAARLGEALPGAGELVEVMAAEEDARR